MTIFRFSALLGVLLIGGCGQSVDDKQTNVLVHLDRRISKLEAAAYDSAEQNNAVNATPNSASDFMNIANNIAEERNASAEKFSADQRLRNIEERLDRLEEKQRESEVREMARNIR